MPPKSQKKIESAQEITKEPLNKKQLLADVIAFFSIINAYLFISITLNYDIFESQLGLELDNVSFIIFLFLSYTAIIFILQGFAELLTFLSKKQNIPNNPTADTISNDVASSLLSVWAVVGVYILSHTFFRQLGIEEFCHIAFWLWIGETARMIGIFVGRLTGIDSLSYWGRSVELILLVGGLLEAVGMGVFALL